METIKIYRRSVSNISTLSHGDPAENDNDFVVVYLTPEFQDHSSLLDELDEFVIFEQTIITTYELSNIFCCNLYLEY